MTLDDKVLTLEDFNTWELKFRYNNNIKYNIPVIETHADNDEIPPLYVGAENQIGDVIGLPDNVEYRVYYNNKPIETFYVHLNDYDDSYSFRVVTKSLYDDTNDVGYVDSDVTITVPVDFKHVESVDDFNNYNYVNLGINIENTTFVIDNDVIIYSNNKTFNNCNITINGNVTIEGGISLLDTVITVNGSLTFKNGGTYIENNNDDYSIVNNNNLIIDNTTLVLKSGLCINNDSLILTNSTLNPLGTSIPLIYDRGSYEIKNNTFDFVEGYDEFGLCIIRTDNIDTFNLYTNNTFNYYFVVLTLSDVEYNIRGNGFAYTMVHKDSIKLYELEE